MTPHCGEDITWIWAKGSESNNLFERGQTKRNRLSLTENCSLVIKNVIVEDATQYTCRGRSNNSDYADLFVSVVKSKY